MAAAGYPSTPKIPVQSYVLSLLALTLTRRGEYRMSTTSPPTPRRADRAALLADPGDGTRIIGYGTMVTPGLGSQGSRTLPLERR